jgi:hypothetical protein
LGKTHPPPPPTNHTHRPNQNIPNTQTKRNTGERGKSANGYNIRNEENREGKREDGKSRRERTQTRKEKEQTKTDRNPKRRLFWDKSNLGISQLKVMKSTHSI